MTSTSEPRPAAPPVARWLLPGELAWSTARPRRTVRDWCVDLVFFGFAVAVWFAQLGTFPAPHDEVPPLFLLVDPYVGAVACVALWWRRRFPTVLALAMFVVLIVSSTGFGAVLVAVLNVAVHRDWWIACGTSALHLVLVVPYAYTHNPGDQPSWIYGASVGLMYLIPTTVGMTVRARRQLVRSMRSDAEHQRAEHRQRVVNARRAERQRIAREMHDVLAHRLSLLSVHAGALSYRNEQARLGRADEMGAVEVEAAVEVIRDSARRALAELGEVLTVLRDDESDDTPGNTRPTLARIPDLVEEAAASGQRVDLAVDGDLSGDLDLSGQSQHTAYRIVQEGLTNARKHAPGCRVGVRVAVVPGEEVRIEVSNTIPPTRQRPVVLGFGAGLSGLAERVGIDGGTLDSGVRDDRFVLSARIPWQS